MYRCNQSGPEYFVCGQTDTIYAVHCLRSGLAIFTSHSRTGTEFAYTVELPDDGRQYGFLLPSSQAPRVGDEMWAALRTLALNILANMDTQD